jgi:hypothetical protein
MSLRYKQAAEDQPPVATEKVGDDHFQLLKLVDPTPGSNSPIGTAANPMKVAGTVAVTDPVNLSEATLAVLESVIAWVSNWPSDFPDAAVLAKLEALRALLAATLTVTGPLTDTQLRAAAVPVSGPLTDTQLRTTPVPVSGTVTASGPLTDTQLRASAVPVTSASPSTGTHSNVASSASSVTVLAANANRKMATFFNDSLASCFLKLDASAASAASFTIKLAPGSYYELPGPVYTGEVRGIWQSADGAMRVVDLT